MTSLKPYAGVALTVVGALLLIGCYVAGIQSNAELLAGLALVILGFILHLWQLKRSEKY